MKARRRSFGRRVLVVALGVLAIALFGLVLVGVQRLSGMSADQTGYVFSLLIVGLLALQYWRDWRRRQSGRPERCCTVPGCSRLVRLPGARQCLPCTILSWWGVPPP